MQRLTDSDPLNTRGLVSSVLGSAQAISESIASAKTNLVSGSADLLASIGEGLASGQASFKSIIKSIINLVADSVISIGKTLIATGIPLALFPATSALGIKQVLTGGAIVLAGGLAKGFAATALESGGLAQGAALIGESAKARAGGGEFVASVDLGANLIGDRIIKKLGAPKFNAPDTSRLGRQSVDVNVSGGFNLRNGDLSASIDDYHQTNQYFN